MTTIAGAFSCDWGCATIDSTALAPCLTVTHSRRRGDLSTAWRAQSCAERGVTPKPVALTPAALPSRNRLLDTVSISDLLLMNCPRATRARILQRPLLHYKIGRAHV